jgi:formylglycine-generating enzyme required for sulfatase activity
LKKIAVVLFFFTTVLTFALVNEASPPKGFVRIEGGTFMMGSPISEPRRFSNELQRKVTVGPFYMGKYEVTQAEYQDVMGSNPSLFRGPNLPVERVTWFNAISFCNRLSEIENLNPAYTINGQNVIWNREADGYRLPTEAEWEYACRAGTASAFFTGGSIATSQANYDGNRPYNNNARGTFRERTSPVGSFEPNTFGLYDMHGNVGEWCWDWNTEYARGEQANPIGAASGAVRVFRGGGWNHAADFLRSARRGGLAPTNRGEYLGFRVVRNAEPKTDISIEQ